VRLEHDSALPWLLGVATNVTRNHRRGLGRRLRLAGRVPAEHPAADHADDVAARVDDERRMADVLAAVRRLPRAQQEALALCVWSAVSYVDAAAVLGIAESGVRARVSKARARRRRCSPPRSPSPRTPWSSHEHDPSPPPVTCLRTRGPASAPGSSTRSAGPADPSGSCRSSRSSPGRWPARTTAARPGPARS
jgi:hypothetical protein